MLKYDMKINRKSIKPKKSKEIKKNNQDQSWIIWVDLMLGRVSKRLLMKMMLIAIAVKNTPMSHFYVKLVEKY